MVLKAEEGLSKEIKQDIISAQIQEGQSPLILFALGWPYFQTPNQNP